MIRVLCTDEIQRRRCSTALTEPHRSRREVLCCTVKYLWPCLLPCAVETTQKRHLPIPPIRGSSSTTSSKGRPPAPAYSTCTYIPSTYCTWYLEVACLSFPTASDFPPAFTTSHRQKPPFVLLFLFLHVHLPVDIHPSSLIRHRPRPPCNPPSPSSTYPSAQAAGRIAARRRGDPPTPQRTSERAPQRVAVWVCLRARPP